MHETTSFKQMDEKGSELINIGNECCKTKGIVPKRYTLADKGVSHGSTG